jgi:predicted kinase
MPSSLIIISGPPCTGKTVLAKRLSADLQLPFISKDHLKELLFDRLGWSDRQWSRLLSLASYDLLFYYLETQLRSGKSLIVESNFKAEYHTTRFLSLKDIYPFQPFQIQCQTDGTVLFERFKGRAQSGGRHPGHVDHLNYDEFRDILLKGRHEPLEIGGGIYHLDTTSFTDIDYDSLLEVVTAHCRQATEIP